VTGLECVRTALENWMRPKKTAILVEGSGWVLKTETVIAAIGDAPDLDYLSNDKRFAWAETTHWKLMLKPRRQEFPVCLRAET